MIFKVLHQTSIRRIGLCLQKLMKEYILAKKIRSDKLNKNRKSSDEILHHQDLLYFLEIIRIYLINKHLDDQLGRCLEIKKTKELIAKK